MNTNANANAYSKLKLNKQINRTEHKKENISLRLKNVDAKNVKNILNNSNESDKCNGKFDENHNHMLTTNDRIKIQDNRSVVQKLNDDWKTKRFR